MNRIITKHADKEEGKRKKEKQDRGRQRTEDKEEKDDDIKKDDDQKREEDEDEDDEERDETEEEERGRNADSEELPSRRDGRKFIKLKYRHCAHHSSKNIRSIYSLYIIV
ncbi:PREDICTED: glutamic acid-rich protein-like, partial [Cyphomyrmex costatus]|uniref:glutamic acid-rich protein-like n=1 Tax=Cyphomyrmex costatus TaxID=456900 RepID=UPI00085221EA